MCGEKELHVAVGFGVNGEFAVVSCLIWSEIFMESQIELKMEILLEMLKSSDNHLYLVNYLAELLLESTENKL